MFFPSEPTAFVAMGSSNHVSAFSLDLVTMIERGAAASAIGYALYSHYYGSKFISTDNAYTAAENAQVTPAISGIVS